MAKINVYFKKPQYAGGELVFPNEKQLHSDYEPNTCTIVLTERGKGYSSRKFVHNIEYEEGFDYNKFQKKIFSLLTPSEEIIQSAELGDDIKASAVLGYSIIPVAKRRFFKDEHMKILYPLAIKFNFKYEDVETGVMKKDGVIALVPSGTDRVAVITNGINKGDKGIMPDIKEYIVKTSESMFDDVELDRKIALIPDRLSLQRYAFTYFDAVPVGV